MGKNGFTKAPFVWLFLGAAAVFLALTIGTLYHTPGLRLGYVEASAPPEPQLTISSNTTWTLAGSPYVITSSVYVSAGVTLTIEPGVVVKFGDNLGILVDGTLIARGTASQPITFTSSRPSPFPGAWSAIKFGDSSRDATYDGDGNYLGGSIIQYAIVEYAGSSVAGAVWLNQAAPFIDHITVRYNTTSGIYAYYSSNLRVTNSIISNNQAAFGGGVYVYGGWGTLSGNTITGNNATYGGGLRVNGAGPLTLRGNTITLNSAVYYGGGIEVYTSTLAALDSDISHNTAAYGGGIYSSGGNVSLRNSTISYNYAPKNGGGIYAYHGRPYGYYDYWGGSFTLVGSTIFNNTAGWSGGGIWGYGTVSVEDNFVSGNTARDYGGGLWARGLVTIQDNTFTSNFSWSNGGAMNIDNYLYSWESWWMSGFFGDIRDNILLNNYAAKAGGGIWASGRNSVSANTLVDNATGGTGGGLYADGGDLGGNTIARNVADAAGGAGGAYLKNIGTFINNTVVGNQAPSWGGLATSGATSFTQNNIFTNEEHGLKMDSSANLNATNNYWGTANASDIEAIIYDFFDSFALGIVYYSPVLTIPNTFAPPSPPTALAASAGATSVALSWAANPEGDVAGYRVYYDTEPGYPYAYSVTVGNSTSYPLTGLTPGLRYYLAVTAYDSGGSESWYSQEVWAETGDMSVGTVVGRVDLQGRTNDGGALVSLTPGVYTATTAADGAFTINNVISGTYTAAAAVAGYLYAQRAGVVVTAGATTNLPVVKLLGGDADRDGDIDIADLVLLGANFGLPVPPADTRADINGDGSVNVYDIVLTGINLGRVVPTPWP
ncbi:MAG: right-handed parallel beta-helix repeat-containing protein [Chloroflexi bacterium]|nr:right-handed parallel beta-helix repeat-containing protein [Chloroflexota bacterium]